MAAKKLKKTNQGKDHLKLLPNLPKKQKKEFINDLDKNINLLTEYPAKLYLDEMKKKDQKALKNFLKKHILQKDSKEMIKKILKGYDDGSGNGKNLAGSVVGAGTGLAISKGGALGLAGAFGAISIPPLAVAAAGAGLGYGLISLLKYLKDFLKFEIEDLEEFIKNAEDVYVTIEQVLNLLMILKEIYKKTS